MFFLSNRAVIKPQTSNIMDEIDYIPNIFNQTNGKFLAKF